MRNTVLAALTLLSIPATAQNLLSNGNAESATATNWTIPIAPNSPTCQGTLNWRGETAMLTNTTARNGDALFFPGCNNFTGSYYGIYQDVDVTSNAVAIDANNGMYTFDGFYSGRNVAAPDNVGFNFEFLDVNHAYLADEYVLVNSNNYFMNATLANGSQTPWAYIQHTMTVPIGTRFIRVHLLAQHNEGTDIDAYFDDLGLAQGSVALALGLTRFDASATANGSVSLVWEDSRSEENAGYDAEWSTDGKHWKTIGHVATDRGISASYSHLHRNPARGSNYYRVAAIGLDGSLEYGATKVVNIQGDALAAPATLWPVPAANAVTIGGLHAGLAGTSAMLLDAQGRVVRSLALDSESTAQLSLQGLTPGFYTLRLADGQVLRVVKD